MKDILITIFLTAIVLIGGLYISDIQNKIGSTDLVFITIYILAIVIISFIISSIILKKEFFDKNTLFIDNLKEENLQFQEWLKKFFITSHTDWVYTAEEVSKIEIKYAKEVWVATSDLEEDGIDGVFADTVTKNLKKGVIYRYFVPKTPTINTAVSRLKNKHSIYLNRELFFHYLDDDFFYLIAKFDFGIINPTQEKNRFGFMGISISSEQNEERLQILMSSNLMNELIGKLEEIKNANKS